MLVVRGNTTLPTLEIEKAVYPFEGPGRTLADLNAARDALQKAYQDLGYQSVVVELPQQQVKNGVILLQVTEAKVGRLRVDGAKYNSPQNIRDGARAGRGPGARFQPAAAAHRPEPLGGPAGDSDPRRVRCRRRSTST